jgi:hypothetical protein
MDHRRFNLNPSQVISPPWLDDFPYTTNLLHQSAQRRASDALQSVACTLLLAIRFESFVESDGALRITPIERLSEKNFLWHPLMHKSRNVFEPEFPVVIRMSHETTSLSIHIFQP